MSVMDNMMRQHRWALDERRRFLAELESLALRLRRDAQRLHQEIEEEAGTGRILRQSGAPYPVFVEPLIERGRQLERSIAEIETQIPEAREAAAAAEQQVRLYEATQAQRSGKPLSGAGRAPRSRRAHRATAIPRYAPYFGS
jgi:flagellar FliJ protein